ncbi:hypothetical protein NECAME_03297 [Necator americanus]|uniref:Lysozyme n=1 Tax=Necator americanus TaxID=51031 RepID=W2T874_NECAM|nr:hypothetical protein NECAME_03297 [Necator americanus]ETN77197.1 hypothetical protein NECAME_03297 [Necator americanus]
MQTLIVLPTLLAVALGKAVGPEKIVTAASGYAYAVDLAVPVPVSAFTCLKNSGYSAVFVRGYDPASAGKFDANAVNNIRNAKKAGLECEVFMTPQPRSGPVPLQCCQRSVCRLNHQVLKREFALIYSARTRP